LARRHSVKNSEQGYRFKYQWKVLPILSIIFFGILSGIIMSFIGAGVTFIMTLLMLKLNFPKETCFYTSILIEVSVRLGTSIQYIMNRSMEYEHVLYFSLFAVLGAFLGIFFFYVIGRYQIQWIVYIVMLFVMIVATISNTVYDVSSILANYTHEDGIFVNYSY
jgi:uncharacterized membrane protein YfcA